MPKVTLKHKNESFESMMRRWKRSVENSDILKTLRKYEFYERPGDRRKRAHAAAVKRQQRITQEENWIRLGIQPHQRLGKKDKDKDDRKKRHQNTEDHIGGMY